MDFEKTKIRYSGAQKKLIYEKNLESKISCQTSDASTVDWA
jgi:hypothetical protein